MCMHCIIHHVHAQLSSSLLTSIQHLSLLSDSHLHNTAAKAASKGDMHMHCTICTCTVPYVLYMYHMYCACTVPPCAHVSPVHSHDLCHAHAGLMPLHYWHRLIDLGRRLRSHNMAVAHMTPPQGAQPALYHMPCTCTILLLCRRYYTRYMM